MNKGFAPLLMLIVLLVVGGLVGGAYYLGQESNNNQTSTSELVATPLASASSVPSQSIAPASSPKSTPKPATVYDYTGWQTYSDTQAGFSIKYSPQHKVDTSGEGEGVNFLFCGSGTCMSGFGIGIYNDYDGGSRRAWLNSKSDLSTYNVTTEDFSVAGVNALIVKASDPGSMGRTYVVIPKGKKVYLFSKESGQEILDEVKKIVSSFKFI